jgi:hypothetical protein
MEGLPYVRRQPELSDSDRDRMLATLEQHRAEVKAEREAQAPARRRAILSGPALRDVEAAVGCLCSCHPRTAEVSFHNGGVTCPCQQTLEERQAAVRALAGSIPVVSFGDGDLREAAVRLGVELRSCLPAAPFVVSGVVDGRGFYLRERHDEYRVCIAPDSEPGSDPWHADGSVPEIVVAHGVTDNLLVEGRWDPVRALEVAVAAVRTFLLRRTCVHAVAENYCATCGVNMAHAAAWRLPQV